MFNLLPGKGLAHSQSSLLAFGLIEDVIIQAIVQAFWDYKEDLIMSGISDFFRGDTKKYRIVLKDTEGTPISIHNSRLTMTMKTSRDLPDEDSSLQVTVVGVEADVGNPTGIIDIVLSSTDTTIDTVNYFYDFQIVNSANEVTTLLSGKVKVLIDTTRTAV